MATRTHAREMVVELLYAYAMGNERIFDFADELLNAKKIRNAQADFAKGLFKGIVAHLQNIDGIIEANLKSWELSRLGVIDKCILRLGVYEILKGEIDAPVAINEAIEIAKILGAENTGRFVNGVLDAISKGGFDLTKGVESHKNSSLGVSFTRIVDLDSATRTQNAESSLDSANSQNLDKNNPCEAPKNSPASWCKKSEKSEQKCERRFFARSGKSEALPLKAKKRSFLARRGSGVGGAALFAKETSESKKPKKDRFAKSIKKSTKTQNLQKKSKSGFASVGELRSQRAPRFAKGKSRNDKSISKPTNRTHISSLRDSAQSAESWQSKSRVSNKKTKYTKSQNSRRDSKGGLLRAKRTRNDNIKSQKSAQKGNKK